MLSVQEPRRFFSPTHEAGGNGFQDKGSKPSLIRTREETMAEARAWIFFRKLAEQLVVLHRERVQIKDYQNTKQSDYGLMHVAEVFCSANIADKAKAIFSEFDDAGERAKWLAEFDKAHHEGTLLALVARIREEERVQWVHEMYGDRPASLKDTIMQMADSAAEFAKSGDREKAAELFAQIFSEKMPEYGKYIPRNFGYTSCPEAAIVLSHVAEKQYEAGFDSTETIAMAFEVLKGIPKGVSYHALDSDSDRAMAITNIMLALAKVGRLQEAMELYPETWVWSGFHPLEVYTLVDQHGKHGADMLQFSRALLELDDKRIAALDDEWHPDKAGNNAILRWAIGKALKEHGHVAEARALYEDALEHANSLKPDQTKFVRLYQISMAYASTLRQFSPEELSILREGGEKELLEIANFIETQVSPRANVS